MCDVVRGAAGVVVDVVVVVVVVVGDFIASMVKTHCSDKYLNQFFLNFIRSCSQYMHTSIAKTHLMTSCLVAIMLLIKELLIKEFFKNNTDTFPTASDRRIKNALPIRTPHGHTCLWDFAKSLHANANDINVATTENNTHAIRRRYNRTVQPS